MCESSLCMNDCGECRLRVLAGPQYDPARRTGRTTRSVHRAISAMLRGQKVLLLVSRQAMVSYASDLANEWLESNGWLSTPEGYPAVERPMKDVFRFGTGALSISSAEANCAGARVDLSITDHSYDELMAERARQEQRQADSNTIKLLMRKNGWAKVTDCLADPTNPRVDKLVFRT